MSGSNLLLDSKRLIPPDNGRSQDNAPRRCCRFLETEGGGGGEPDADLAAAIAQFDVPCAPSACFPALFNRCGKAQGQGASTWKMMHYCLTMIYP